MAEEREKSPHYIPELDPEHPASGPRVGQPVLLTILSIGLLLVLVGGVLLSQGMQKAGFICIGIGAVLLSPILI